jgi:anti-sigma-K factor RskA
MNLDHSGVQALLDEYIDGGLAAEECGEVERHLESCVECAAEVESLLALRARTRDLPREIAPGRDLWPEIQARLQAVPARQVAAPERLVGAEVGVIDLAARRGRATRWSGGVLGRAAAVIALIVLSSGATAYLLRGRGTAPVAVAPAAPQSQATGNVRLAADRDISTFRAGSGGFEGAVEGLRTTFESHRDRLSPETVKIVEQNLAIIDRAIAESRAALEKDPNDPDLPLLLSGVYRQKLELLQQAVQLQARS